MTESNERTPAPSDATIRAVLTVSGFEYTDAIWWSAVHDGLRLYVKCSDFFAWGTADLEEITDDNHASLLDTVAECEGIIGGKWDAYDAFLLWCSRQRKMRPQGAYYKHLDTRLWHLFDAAGPERATDMFNPKPHPAGASS